MGTHQLRRRAGFTLVEVLVAMVILAIALASAQAVLTDRLISRVGEADRRMIGMQLAQERLQLIQAEPSYDLISSRYAGTESAVPGFEGFARETTVTRTRNVATGLDYTTILVRVTHPLIPTPMTRVAVVAAP